MRKWEGEGIEDAQLIADSKLIEVGKWEGVKKQN